jgi:hypothetical protein
MLDFPTSIAGEMPEISPRSERRSEAFPNILRVAVLRKR